MILWDAYCQCKMDCCAATKIKDASVSPKDQYLWRVQRSEILSRLLRAFYRPPAAFLTSRSHKRKIAILEVGELEAEQGPLRRHIRCEVNDIGVVAVAADESVVAGVEETVERVVRRAPSFDAEKKLRWRCPPQLRI